VTRTAFSRPGRATIARFWTLSLSRSQISFASVFVVSALRIGELLPAPAATVSNGRTLDARVCDSSRRTVAGLVAVVSFTSLEVVVSAITGLGRSSR
jgi:hypothetical protein